MQWIIEHENQNKTSLVLQVLCDLEDEEVVVLAENRFSKFTLRVPLLMYSWSAGLFCGLQTVFLKCFAELAKNPSNFASPMIYICLACFAFSIVMQLRVFNQGLSYYNQLEVIPIY